MKRWVMLLLCVVMAVGMLLMSGCADTQDEAGGQRTVVDIKGKEVAIPQEVERYCILYSSAFPMCGMLDEGLEHMVMCPTLYADWAYRLFPDIDEHAVVVDKRSVTAEQIVESGAQVVFWSSSSHEELIASLEQLGIACVNVAVSDADDLISAMDIIADTFGTEYAAKQNERYKEVLNQYKEYAEEHAALIPDSEKKSILVLGGIEERSAFGEDTYEAYWSGLVGLEYIVPSDDGSGQANLTMEQIYEFAPDIITVEAFFDEEACRSDPAWSSLEAVKNGLLISNPSVLDTWSKPGAEAPLQYIWAFARFYPEYAGDVDVMEETQSFYKEFYDYDMSDDEAERMLAGQRIIFE